MVVPREKKDIEDVGRRLPGVLLSGYCLGLILFSPSGF